MADNATRIVLTAIDQTGAAIASARKSMASLGDSAGLLNQTLGGMAGALSIGTFAGFVKGSIDAADTMNDLSQKIGIGIKDLAAWKLAAEQSGTSMESVAKGVKSLSVYMVEHGDKLRAAGITATDANGAMIQLADLFKAMPDGVQKTALAMQLMGKAGMDMIPVMNMGSAGLKDAQEKAKAYGDKLAEMAPKADEFNDMMSEFSVNSQAAGMNIASYFLPGLTGMAKWLNDIATGGEKAQQAVEWLVGERTMRAMVLAGHPGLTGSGSRSASGRIGGKPAAMSLAEEELLGEKNIAGMRAAGLLDKSTAKSTTGKASRGIDDENDVLYKINEAVRKQARAGFDERDAADAKAVADSTKRINDLLAATPTGQLEKAREEMQFLAAALEKGNITEEQFLEVTSMRLEAMTGKGKDAFDGLSQAVESWGNKAADTFAEFAVTGKASFGDLVNSMLMDIARLQAKKMLDPITKGASDWLGGAFSSGLGGLFGGGAAASEWDFGPSMPDLGLSFAGGGYTGGGPRSGGLDGQGGFMAMLHPQESVIDHARSGGGGTAPDVIINLVNQTGQPATARQQGAPSFDGSNWVISVIMEAAGSNPGFRAAMGLGR